MSIPTDALIAELRLENNEAFHRCRELHEAVRGLLGLLELISTRDDVSPELREILRTNHRIEEAKVAIGVEVDPGCRRR